MDFGELSEQLREFASKRDWEQFHSPKNLSMALSVEVAELVEHFQWLTQAESTSLDSTEKDSITEEIADIQIYLAMLADRLSINIDDAVRKKIDANADKYPAGDDSTKKL